MIFNPLLEFSCIRSTVIILTNVFIITIATIIYYLFYVFYFNTVPLQRVKKHTNVCSYLKEVVSFVVSLFTCIILGSVDIIVLVISIDNLREASTDNFLVFYFYF
jgi:hypothetical protein